MNSLAIIGLKLWISTKPFQLSLASFTFKYLKERSWLILYLSAQLISTFSIINLIWCRRKMKWITTLSQRFYNINQFNSRKSTRINNIWITTRITCRTRAITINIIKMIIEIENLKNIGEKINLSTKTAPLSSHPIKKKQKNKRTTAYTIDTIWLIKEKGPVWTTLTQMNLKILRLINNKTRLKNLRKNCIISKKQKLETLWFKMISAEKYLNLILKVLEVLEALI